MCRNAFDSTLIKATYLTPSHSSLGVRDEPNLCDVEFYVCTRNTSNAIKQTADCMTGKVTVVEPLKR